MKKFLVVAIVIVILVVTVTICLKSCTNSDTELLNLLPAEPAEITPDPVAIVEQIQQLSRLETASIFMQQVLTAERDQKRLWGAFGEKLVFLAYGQVIAGIDLSQIQEQDILIVDEKTIKIHLPEAEVFNVVLDNKSWVVDRDSGFLAYIDPQLESEVRKKAEEMLLQNALDLGIVEIAQKNAEISIGSLIRKLGFENVEFMESIDTDDPIDGEIIIELN